MEQLFKYLTQSEDDKKWGLYVNVAGYAEIAPNEKYPPKGHPEGYHFIWEDGRVLDEYQMLYITKGKGVFETRTTKFDVKEGDIILIAPYVWHRYAPDSEDGWREHYIGFNGEIMKSIIDFFDVESPVVYVGYNEQILNAYEELFDLTQQERIGYQQAASGYVLFILGKVRQIVLTQGFANNKIEKIINKSRLYMRAHLTEQFSMQALAEELNISYSLFRSEFKKYTGISPGQYLLQLKIQTAKNLLSNTAFTVKEIAFKSGFESPYYFSKAFRKYTTISPSEFRDKLKRN
ncbi:AraC family transcriptional regulator [Prolixibacteraceae bacterium JC049]|nr:AraC family transcriptional regulator [Prolixibacteraceae bacterium JC049]